MECYEFISAITPVQQFVWHDFCDNYIELVKYRLYSEDAALQESRRAAQFTLKRVITTSLKLLAPFTPFFSEEVFSNFSDKASIFLEPWPEPGKPDADKAALGDSMVEVISQIRKWKSSNNLPMNAEIQKVKISGPPQLKLFEGDIKGAMRAKKVEFSEGELSAEVE